MRGFTSSWLLSLLGIWCSIAQADDYSCSAIKPCAVGCCSKDGVCGLGPKFCGPDKCHSNCDRKAECDPGWGMDWSSASKCPLNVCCSEYGFCGTTKEFCGDKKVDKPKGSGNPASQRTIGYYEGWSQTRACDIMAPEAIPAGAYTHLNYAFAFIDPKSFAVAPMSPDDVVLYPRFTKLKDNNPDLQTWISVGGWSMNDPGPTARTFSDLAGSKDAQQKFFSSLTQFMATHGFDGVDIDWEYPVAPERAGKPEDYDNYVTFLSALRNALNASGHRYGISITLPSSYWYLKNFDIVELEKTVDFFNVMTYDLHGTWDATDKFIGSIVQAHTNLTEIDQTMDLMWLNKIDPAKINMGLGFYGRSFTLSDPSCSGPGCSFSKGGNAGKCSQSEGTLMYAEIEDAISGGAKPTLNKDAAVKELVYDNNQWISYDDEETLKSKLDFANGLGLGGTLVWAVSTDDNVYTASAALMKANGKEGKSLVRSNTAPATRDIKSCTWSDCNGSCPDGLLPAQTGSGKGASNAAIYNGCGKGQSRSFCCPKDDVPQCTWRGEAPFCYDSGSNCKDNEVVITTDQCGGGHCCNYRHKNLCCTVTKADQRQTQCSWEGSGPHCADVGHHAGCPAGKEELTYSEHGWGGDKKCDQGWKSLCCQTPLPYSGCAWVGSTTGGASGFFGGYQCATGCPNDKQIVASDSAVWSEQNNQFLTEGSGRVCNDGTASYFCCDPDVQTTPGTEDLDMCVTNEKNYFESGTPDGSGVPTDIVELTYYDDYCSDDPLTFDDGLYKRQNSLVQSVYQLNLSRLADDWIPRSATHDLDVVYRICLEGTDDGCYELPQTHHPQAEALFASWTSDSIGGHEQAHVLFGHSHLSHTLDDRGVRSNKICKSRKQVASINAYTYCTVLELADHGVPYGGAVLSKVGPAGGLVQNCKGLPYVTGAAQPAVNYVAEHGMELQTVAMFATAMLDSVLPSGAKPILDLYDWAKIFTKSGLFWSSWKALGVPASALGTWAKDNPAQAIMFVMGSKDDWINTLILDSTTNSLKTLMWQGKNFVADDKWRHLTPGEQLEKLHRIMDTLMGYMNSKPLEDGLQHGYEGGKRVFEALQKAKAIVKPQGGSFTDAWAEFMRDHFNTMQKRSQDFLFAKYTELEAAFRPNGDYYHMYTKADAAKYAKICSDRIKDIPNIVALPRGWIT